MTHQTRQGSIAELTREEASKPSDDVPVSHGKRRLSDDIRDDSLETREEATICGSITLSLKSDACRRDEQGVMLCSVEGCSRRMENETLYYRRYKVCKDHLRQWSLLVEGEMQRFCQQCGRFHPVEEFDAKKKNCRMRLEKHNSRRRKYLTAKDGSKIRKQGDMDGKLSFPQSGIADDMFAVDIPATFPASGEYPPGGENGKDLYDTEGKIIGHPTLVAKKIAEYYKTQPNKRDSFYPPFVRHVILTERFLGQRMLQNWMPESTDDDNEQLVLDEDLREAESMVYAIHQYLSLEHSRVSQADLLKDMAFS